jgi:hypothetical protein
MRLDYLKQLIAVAVTRRHPCSTNLCKTLKMVRIKTQTECSEEFKRSQSKVKKSIIVKIQVTYKIAQSLACSPKITIMYLGCKIYSTLLKRLENFIQLVQCLTQCFTFVT